MQDNYGKFFLMVASKNGHVDVVKVLLENNAQVNIHDSFGKSLLVSMAMLTLLENAAQVDIQDN